MYMWNTFLYLYLELLSLYINLLVLLHVLHPSVYLKEVCMECK